MRNLRAGVEVVNAHNLMPKDRQGSSNSFVELHFDGQRYRTTIKQKDLNPVWNERFFFDISDPANLHSLTLDAYVYNNTQGTQSKPFLGKVLITGTSFVFYADSVVQHYPLEKRSIFSRVKGELGLRIYLTDDQSLRSSSNPLPAVDTPYIPHPLPNQPKPSEPEITNTVPVKTPVFEGKSKSRHTFHHLPRKDHHHQQPILFSGISEQAVISSAYEMKSETQPPSVVRMFSTATPQQPVDYALKETSPFLGGGQVVGGRVIRADRPASTYDLVEQMRFLYVRIVKARELPAKDVSGSLDPYVEVRIGNYKGTTKHFEKKKDPTWNEVFAFSQERMQATYLEVVVKDKDLIKDDFVGIVRFDLNEVPLRVPPDSPLAPQWYRLEDKKGEKTKGEIMLAVWIGTQADEAFPDAWHADAASPLVDGSVAAGSHTRSKVYHAPRLWYVRVNVIEAQDLIIADKTRFPDVHVKAQIGNQLLKTRNYQARTFNPMWNEDMLFVAAEPFEDYLILTVEDRVGPNKDEMLGRVSIPLTAIDKRADDRPVDPRWYPLEKAVAVDVDKLKKEKFSSRIHIRVCLDGGYHVLDESTQYSSDLRPTARQLWKPSIGVLELGVLSAEGLHPMKTREGRGTSDTYCVAKYGHKWVRTRTIVNSLSPKFNEQYTWEVYDPATVIIVGVFDNSLIGEKGSGNKDMQIGKVRIRLSTLETGRVYTHSYPLLVLHPSGVKKMGELHLAIRFSSTSLVNMMQIYSRPLLPKMHYIRPLTVAQLDLLRFQAVKIVAARLSRAEPPLRKEVVEYITDVNSHLWSMRKSKANFFRLMAVFSGLFAVGKWFGDVCYWKNPITTVMVHVLFLMLVCFPELMLPTLFLYMFFIGIWNYRYRPRYPPHMDTKISHAEAIHPDELDEEFDSFPTSRSPELVKMRYDRLRSVAGRMQTVVGDIATQGERVLTLLSWRDPRATGIFLIFCFLAAMVFYVTPFQVITVVAVFYLMRHPRFRHRLPSAPLNYFRRLPARTDCLL